MSYLSKLKWPIYGLVMSLPTLALAHPETEHFGENAFIKPPEIVDCVLENGAATRCYELTVGYQPVGLEEGPFCPETMDDVGGIWYWTGEQDGLYRLDGAFFTLLDGLGYRFFNDDGTINIVDNATSPPQVDHACINVTPDEDVQMTILLPIDPVMAQNPTYLGTVAQVGIALDGAPIFADAPSIQDTGHLPALDRCGGHIDPGGWYHWHATATDVQSLLDDSDVDVTCALVQDSTAQFGYAFDGFAIYGSHEADGSVPSDLDSCGGHVGATSPADEPLYHYHAQSSFPNLPSCLVGVTARNNFSTTASAGVGAARGQGRGPGGAMPPGFEHAASALGVSVEDLMEVLQDAGGPRPDLSSAAAALGVTEEDLRNALPPPPSR